MGYHQLTKTFPPAALRALLGGKGPPKTPDPVPVPWVGGLMGIPSQEGMLRSPPGLGTPFLGSPHRFTCPLGFPVPCALKLSVDLEGKEVDGPAVIRVMPARVIRVMPAYIK